jgi:septal ring factor EnvC (AmiA/AmiB activator)
MLLLAPLGSAVADPARSLETVEQSLGQAQEKSKRLKDQAGKIDKQLVALRRRAVSIAAKARNHEETMLQLTDRLATFEKRRSTIEKSLKTERAGLAAMLAALQRIALNPPIAMIALPESPLDTIRSGLLLRGLVPVVEMRARRLRTRLGELAALSDAVGTAREKLANESQLLIRERQILAALVRDRAKIARTTRANQRRAQQRAARLGREASTLRDLIARLTAARPAIEVPPEQKSTPEAARELQPPEPAERRAEPEIASITVIPDAPLLRRNKGSILPVVGTLVRRFGRKDETGARTRGIAVSAANGATVISPRRGQVVFAGPFKGLGKLLIIEIGRKYHLLIGGMERIDVAVGEPVMAGEPVGIMSGDVNKTTSKETSNTLYLELRRNGRPINPMPWLSARRDRKNG